MSIYDEKRRKWFLQMSQIEVYRVRGAVLKFQGWVFNSHALDEMQDDRVSKEDVFKVLQYGKVMEVHNCDPSDLCAMLRYTIGKRSIAVVVSLITGRIVTVFANSIQSGMRKPDMSLYKWQADLSGIETVSMTNMEVTR